MSHTPRPWVCRHWDGNQQIVIESVHHRGPNELALVRPPLTATPHDGWTCTAEDVAENEANARLIAAAPELLEACKQLAEFWQNGTPVNAGSWPANDVLAAIAKAEGKECA